MARRKRKPRMTWRRVEDKLFIPNRRWSTALAQQFADLYADSINQPRKPVVFDLGTRGGRGKALGTHWPDRISISLVLDSRERWRVLIHELAHYLSNGHDKRFIERMRFIHHWFREWEKAI